MRSVVRRGKAEVEGLGVELGPDDVLPELTLTADGAFLHPFAPTVRHGVDRRRPAGRAASRCRSTRRSTRSWRRSRAVRRVRTSCGTSGERDSSPPVGGRARSSSPRRRSRAGSRRVSSRCSARREPQRSSRAMLLDTLECCRREVEEVGILHARADEREALAALAGPGAVLIHQEDPGSATRSSPGCAGRSPSATRRCSSPRTSPGSRRAACGTALAPLARGADVVLGPCPDGGYWLVGMREALAAPFAAIPWSTPAVLETTLDALPRGGPRGRARSRRGATSTRPTTSRRSPPRDDLPGPAYERVHCAARRGQCRVPAVVAHPRADARPDRRETRREHPRRHRVAGDRDPCRRDRRPRRRGRPGRTLPRGERRRAPPAPGSSGSGIPERARRSTGERACGSPARSSAWPPPAARPG